MLYLDSLSLSLFSPRKQQCAACRSAPATHLLSSLSGRHGETIVTLSDFPIRSCTCSEVRAWAFEPDLELSQQLFGGLRRATKARQEPSCCTCEATRLNPDRIILTSEAHLAGFNIYLAVNTFGVVCCVCGTPQLTSDALRVDRRGGGSEIIAAFNAALDAIGLAQYY
jgi:hypothetical protein